jgi:ankyrin repeat protein
MNPSDIPVVDNVSLCPILPVPLPIVNRIKPLVTNILYKMSKAFNEDCDVNYYEFINSIDTIPKPFRDNLFYFFLLNFALHQPSVTTKIINYLIAQSHDILLMRDRDGKLPLHIALDNILNIDIIHSLVDPCPKSVAMQAPLGDTSLHIACSHKYVDLKIISFLIFANPNVVRYSTPTISFITT